MTIKTKTNSSKIVCGMLAGCVGILLATGCTDVSNIQKQQKITRANYGEDIIAEAAAGSGIGMSQSGTGGAATQNGMGGSLAMNAGTGAPAIPGAGASTKIVGVWEFTTPPTVSRTKKSTEQYDQFSLFWSNAEPTDAPILVITTGSDLKSLVEASPDDYTVKQAKSYLLNGQPAKEFNGYTKAGLRFCEVIVAHGTGDDLHAIAIVKDDQQAKVALNILGSITWKPKK